MFELGQRQGGAVKYLYGEHLSPRVVADASGNKMGDQGHYPFGEAWYETGTPDKWKFTSYERDAESALDYAMFRYDSSRLGRFLTPDPIAGSIADPQTLNRYAYVRNDPGNLVDRLGLNLSSPGSTGWCPPEQMNCGQFSWMGNGGGGMGDGMGFGGGGGFGPAAYEVWASSMQSWYLPMVEQGRVNLALNQPPPPGKTVHPLAEKFILDYMDRFGLTAFIVALQWTGNGYVLQFYAGVREHLDNLVAKGTFAPPTDSWFWGALHKDQVGGVITGDYRSYTGNGLDWSLQVVLGEFVRSGTAGVYMAWVDIDRWNPKQDLFSLFAHFFGEVLF